MQKLIFITLLATTFTNHIICMKRQRAPEATDTNKRQCLPTTSDLFLPKELQRTLCKDVVASFKFSKETPEGVALVIKRMRAVNREWRNFFDSPDTIRTIISNTSSIPYYRGFLAHSSCLIDLPSVQNYIEQSENLIRDIKTLDHGQVKAMIEAGADINYCYELAGNTLVYPILWHTQNNYDKTKMLLGLGADQNIQRNSLTPLGFAVFYRNLKMIGLFLEYKPQKKHVKDAIQADSLEVLQLILQQKDISAEDIEDGKRAARKQENDLFLQLLDEYKNDK